MKNPIPYPLLPYSYPTTTNQETISLVLSVSSFFMKIQAHIIHISILPTF